MGRLEPAPVEQYAPLFGEHANPRAQIYAHRPELAKQFIAFGQTLRKRHVLPARLLELVRIRVAFHNQCRSCMALRYGYAVEDGLTEDLVCSLERPEEAPDLTEAERAAIAYADLLATDHHAIDDEIFASLQRHFSAPEIVELFFHVAFYVGFGRMAMTLDVTDDLPEGYRREGAVTPWGQDEVLTVAEEPPS